MSSTPVIVFIHGTLPLQPLMHIPLVNRFFRCPKGITKLSDTQDSHAKDILTTLCSKHPTEFPQEHCYTFGWSGTLKHIARKKAAQELYTELKNLQESYHTNGQSPRIHLLTHSHGGNVALWLKHIAEMDTAPENVTIDELILLACPVQLETAQHTSDKIFKKVYSIYSNHDLLQIIDPQGLHAFFDNLKTYGLEFTLANLQELGPLFSERQFPQHSNITQLNVKYSHRELLHIEFLMPQFIEALPTLIKKMRQAPQSDTQAELTHVFKNEKSS